MTGDLFAFDAGATFDFGVTFDDAISAGWSVSPLEQVRHTLAAVLAGPWLVCPAAPDAVPGPCLVIMTGTLDPAAIGCTFHVHPVILCVAGHPDAPPAMDILDAQTVFVLARLQTAGNVALDRVEGEARTDFGGVAYITKRVVCHTTVTIEPAGGAVRPLRTFGAA